MRIVSVALAMVAVFFAAAAVPAVADTWHETAVSRGGAAVGTPERWRPGRGSVATAYLWGTKASNGDQTTMAGASAWRSATHASRATRMPS